MNASLDELRTDLAAARAELQSRKRAWQKLCLQHGGAKTTAALAWGRDDELAAGIRAVRWPYRTAANAFRKAEARFQSAALHEVASRTLKLIQEQEAAHA